MWARQLAVVAALLAVWTAAAQAACTLSGASYTSNDAPQQDFWGASTGASSNAVLTAARQRISLLTAIMPCQLDVRIYKEAGATGTFHWELWNDGLTARVDGSVDSTGIDVSTLGTATNPAYTSLTWTTNTVVPAGNYWLVATSADSATARLLWSATNGGYVGSDSTYQAWTANFARETDDFIFRLWDAGGVTTPTPTVVLTATPTRTVTPTATFTASPTPTLTGVVTVTPTPTPTITATPGMATTIHVNAGTTACNSSTGTGSFGSPYSSLYYALTQTTIPCGTTIELHGTTNNGLYATNYANGCGGNGTASATYANCGSYVGADSCFHSVATFTQQCPLSNPIVLQNYCASANNCDSVVLDGTPAKVLNKTITWNQCSGGACCGAAAPNLPAQSSTYCTTGLNGGSKGTIQVWADPVSITDPGTRLKWAFDPPAIVQSRFLADHDNNMVAGTFANTASTDVADCQTNSSCGKLLTVRMPDGTSPNTHDLRIASEGGDGGGFPIEFYGATGIVVRKNPLGGTFAVRGGYNAINFDNAAQNITIDGLKILATGSREYGQCIRTGEARNITVQNIECSTSAAEGVAFYGGSGTAGIQLSGNVLQDSYVHDTGFATEDGGGFSTGPNLGMGVILKNCDNCAVKRTRVRNTFRSGIEITVVPLCRGVTCRSDNVLIENNDIANTCHDIVRDGSNSAPSTFPPTRQGIADCGGIEYQDQQGGTMIGGIIRNNIVRGDYSPSFTAPAPGIKMESDYTARVLGNSVANTNGECLKSQFHSGVLTVRNNIFNNCGASSGACNGNQPCNWMVDNGAGDIHTHSNNTYWAPTDRQVVRLYGGGSYTRSGVSSFEASAVKADPLFVSSTDLHLQTSSTLRDAGTNTDCTGTTDIDGEARPINSTCEVGADELPASGVTPTPTVTVTPILTSTPPVPTITPTRTPTPTITVTVTPTVTRTPTPTPTVTATSILPVATVTATFTPGGGVATPTPAVTVTPTATATIVASTSCQQSMAQLQVAILQLFGITVAQVCQ